MSMQAVAVGVPEQEQPVSAATVSAAPTLPALDLAGDRASISASLRTHSKGSAADVPSSPFFEVINLSCLPTAVALSNNSRPSFRAGLKVVWLPHALL
jgi:hypothetical protein